jgi:two-component system, NarL family, nitrate/nitrite response regulator NarL
MPPIKVLVADDSDIVRRAIRQLLQQHPEIELVGEAANFSETIRMAADLKPQVVVMDLHMDDGKFTPVEVMSHLNAFTSRIVAISIWNDEKAKELAESLGAVAFLDKMDLSDNLIPTIQKFAVPPANLNG